MAKKLYGAAAAAHAKKVGRRRRRRSSKALARRGPVAVVGRRRRRRSVAVVGRRRRSSSGPLGGLTPLLTDMGYSAGYGWISKGGSGSAAVYARMLLEKITPDSIVASVGRPATHGLILHFGAKYIPGLPGIVKRTASRLGKAALLHAAHNFGASGLDLQAAASLEGDEEYDNTLSGAMDADYDESVEGYEYDNVSGYEYDNVAGDDDPGEE